MPRSGGSWRLDRQQNHTLAYGTFQGTGAWTYSRHSLVARFGTFQVCCRKGSALPLARTQDSLLQVNTLDRPQRGPIASVVTPDRAGVELRSISVRYKSAAAIRGIDLTIRDGEFFSLLGPSGCGKTSTLNVIGGFIEPSTGDVLIQGRSVRHLPPYRRPVNTVFQSYALFPHMTVAENVAFGPRMAGETGSDLKRRVHEALGLVSLVGMEDRRPDQLSGGQQQRVALARALINRPAVLLLDEPLGALDLKLRKQMQVELSRIQREVGITFVYVTHDQEEAMTMSDRIAVMNHGRVEQVGTPQDVYDRPANLFVADFIGSSNILLGTLVESNAGIATVQLDAGAIAYGAHNYELTAGQRVAMAIRPDDMQLTADDTDGEYRNHLCGRVTKVSFLGTHRQVVVTTGDGIEVMLRQPPATISNPPGPDEPVSIGWSSERSTCFPVDRE
jgi:spermidine/putrescine transport system ATP-binding protein